MAWCEENNVHYVFGLARNARLEAEIADELAEAEQKTEGEPASAVALFSPMCW